MKPARWLRIAGLALLTVPAHAWAWAWGPALLVSTAPATFHHMEASGRQSLAVSAGHVAIAWEDDRDGTPRCYLALVAPGQSEFQEHPLGRGECYAPGLTPLPDGRFAVIWEDAEGVAVSLVDKAGVSPPLSLAAGGGQGALAWHPNQGLLAVWTAPEGRWRQLWLARLAAAGAGLSVIQRGPLEAQAPKDVQQYPALTATPTGFALAWEDRRLGHTVIFASQSPDGQTWSPPARVSHNATGRAQGTDLGRGTGAMRPAVTGFGSGVAYVWLDKRDFLSGYDVYAALPTHKKNLKVQDSFGDAIAQWHPAVASNRQGTLVAAWDDDRDGTQDIWLSTLGPDGQFQENQSPGPLGGPGRQSDPALALEADGNLHVAWIHRDENGRSRLMYVRGRSAE